jgi:hypothetical protein
MSRRSQPRAAQVNRNHSSPPAAGGGRGQPRGAARRRGRRSRHTPSGCTSGARARASRACRAPRKCRGSPPRTHGELRPQRLRRVARTLKRWWHSYQSRLLRSVHEVGRQLRLLARPRARAQREVARSRQHRVVRRHRRAGSSGGGNALVLSPAGSGAASPEVVQPCGTHEQLKSPAGRTPRTCHDPRCACGRRRPRAGEDEELVLDVPVPGPRAAARLQARAAFACRIAWRFARRLLLPLVLDPGLAMSASPLRERRGGDRRHAPGAWRAPQRRSAVGVVSPCAPAAGWRLRAARRA